MNKQSLFFTSLVAIVAIALMIMALQFLTKKLNIKPEVEDKINTSYAIWSTSIFITFFMFLKVALEQTENAIEVIIYSKTIDNTFIEVMQKIVIFIGFTFFFTFLSYYVVNAITKITFGNKVDSIEIERENKGYFIMKGSILLLLVFSLITIFEHFLRWFAPVVNTPFFH
ncbi:hypothetical protein [Flavobacterium sp.]|uniref:hypothetical protein n=1 Tax=Flavobacterium sp. TaxID=239 RepID=UPI0025E5034B|nr:hypothetical protein [Flavobacterium sp.]